MGKVAYIPFRYFLFVIKDNLVGDFEMIGCHIERNFQVTVAGGSYQDGLSAIVRGHTPWMLLTEQEIYGDLFLRKPGAGELSSPRKEPDLPIIYTGLNAADTVEGAKNKNTAIFLDRDGTIIEDNGYLRNPSEVIFFSETLAALQELQKYFLLFIVTNQPGVARGIINHEDVNKINTMIINTFAKAGIEITDIYVCPHERSNNCDCIKPNSYFLEKAAKDYHIDLQRSFVIGDHPCDVQLAKNVGARGIFVLTGHGNKHIAELPEDTEMASGIMEAAEKIISHHLNAKVSGLEIN